jgi:hypothetical protein
LGIEPAQPQIDIVVAAYNLFNLHLELRAVRKIQLRYTRIS